MLQGDAEGGYQFDGVPLEDDSSGREARKCIFNNLMSRGRTLSFSLIRSCPYIYYCGQRMLRSGPRTIATG